MRDKFKMNRFKDNIIKVYGYGVRYRKNLVYQMIGFCIRLIFGVVVPILAAKQLVEFSNNKVSELVGISIVIACCMVVQYCSTVLIRKNTQIFRRGTVKNLQTELAESILNIEQTRLDDSSAGLFQQRMIIDTDNMSKIFTSGMSCLADVICNIGIFIVIYNINLNIFIYYVFCTLVLVLLHLSKVSKYTVKDRIYRKASEDVATFTNELVVGAKDIKLLSAKTNVVGKFSKVIDSQVKANHEMRNVEIGHDFIINMFTAGFELILVCILIALINNGQIAISLAIVAFTYKTKITDELMGKIGELITEVKGFNLSCDRVFQIIKSKEFKKEKFGCDKILGKLEIEFENVSFEYEEGNKVLENVSFKIYEGKTVAFVGKSGAGKTTIFNALSKLLDVTSGKIYIAGKEIVELSESEIRENMAVITQNPYIFGMSIRENFQLVKKDVTDDQIEAACKIACISEYIEDLPKKYDTQVGANGVTFSGGQKQRLAIARALIGNPRIILFDEATSALDNKTQREIHESIEKLKGKYTIIVIAHRLSTIINLDEIIVMDNGKIASRGTHKELLEISSQYKELYASEENYIEC